MGAEADMALRRLRWIYLAFMGAALVYLSFALQTRASDVVPWFDRPEAWLWALRIGLAALSVASLLVLEAVVFKRQTEPRTTSGSAGSLSPPIQRAYARGVIRGTFHEAIAIYGLLLFLLGDHFVDLGVFCTVSLLALAWHFPTRERWTREIAEAPAGAPPIDGAA